MHTTSTSVDTTLSFIAELTWDDIPAAAQKMLRRCVLDLCGTMIAGSTTALSRIAREVAAQAFGGDEATLLFDSRRVSLPGAALANGMTLDAMDMHDGYRPAKGHAGATVFPAALAVGERSDWTGQELATAVVVGYEVGLRAAVALHRSACEYHTSGAWGALGAAAVAARGLGLNTKQMRHALGIAEYHGPRSPMMRVIGAPSMLKDGSGWGSMTGVLAAQLARAGFSGAPAATLETVDLAPVWDDLGQRWLINEIYFKPYACCRWAQPAIRAALALVHEHKLSTDRIANVQVETFHAATQLRISRPQNTDEAQYSLSFPLAAALIHGRLDPVHVMAPVLFDADVLDLADRVSIAVDPDLEDRFPGEALARVRIEMDEGRSFESDVCSAPGDPQMPLSDTEIVDKYKLIAQRYLRPEHINRLRRTCWEIAELDSVKLLVDLLGLATPPSSVKDG
jgi:2-methylcitrate dehydratase PrpD